MSTMEMGSLKLILNKLSVSLLIFLGIFYLYTKMRVKNAGAGDLFTFGLNTEALLDFLESGAQILLSAALLPQQSRKHLVCGHLDLSKWGFLEFA